MSASSFLFRLFGRGTDYPSPSYRQIRALPATLPPGTVNVAYGPYQLLYKGGTAPVKWTLDAGNPSGITLTENGVLAGTPTATGTISLRIRITDVHGMTDTENYSIRVESAVEVTTTALPGVQVGFPVSLTLAVVGGRAPYNWTYTQALPAGLSLSSGGVLSGTPTVAGTATLAVRVTDVEGRTASASWSLTIAPAATLTVTTTSLPTGTVGTDYSGQLAAINGAPPYTWIKQAGPIWATVDRVTGAITGTPDAAFSGVLGVRCVDSGGTGVRASIPLTVIAVPQLQITTTTIPQGAVGVTYDTTLAAVNAQGNLSWYFAGARPGWLNLDANTGRLYAATTSVGTFTVKVGVLDTVSGQQATATYSLVILSGLSISNTSLGSGIYGVDYVETLVVLGGAGSYTYNFTATPPWMTTTPLGQLCVLGGIPNATGSETVSVTVTNTLTGQTVSGSWTLTVNPALAITTSSIPATISGAAYSAPVNAVNGSGAYVWSFYGSRPSWLSINASTGNLSGTAGTSGTFSVPVQVVDANTQETAQVTFSLVVAPALSIQESSIAGVNQGASYSQSLTPVGGSGNYGWSFGSSHPAWLLIDASTGTLSATSALNAGTFTFTVILTDYTTGEQASRTYQLVVTAVSLTISTTDIGHATIGFAYSKQMAGSSGTWSLSAGALPAGVSINSSGLISGTPTSTGTFTPTIRVTSGGVYTEKQFTLISAVDVGLRAKTFLTCTSGVAFTDQGQAQGGVRPYSYSLLSGSLPPGLALTTVLNNVEVWQLAGTPTQSGSYTFTIGVTDAEGRTNNRTFSLTVASGVQITTTTISPIVVGGSYSGTLTASGVTGTAVWSIVDNGGATNLTINSSTGALGGTAIVGDFTVTFKVTDSPSGLFNTKQIVVSVTASSLTVSTTTLPNGTVGVQYSATLAAQGGTAPYTAWALTSGTLPTGLSLNTSTGVISGTPSATATATSLTFRVTDTATNTASKTVTLTISAAVSTSAWRDLVTSLSNVTVATFFDTKGEVDNYILKNGSYQEDILLPPAQRRWQWVTAGDPEAALIPAGQNGFFKLVIKASQGESSIDWTRKVLGDSTSGMQGIGPASAGLTDEIWISFGMYVDDYLANSSWDHTSGSGGWKFFIFDKWYKSSTFQEIVANHRSYMGYPCGYLNRYQEQNWVTYKPDVGDEVIQPEINHQSSATHPLHLDPTTGTTAEQNRKRRGGIYGYRNINNAGGTVPLPRSADTGLSGGIMFSRDMANKWCRFQLHVKVNDWDAYGATGTSLVEWWVALPGEDWRLLYSENQANLGRDTDVYNFGNIHSTYEAANFNPSGNADRGCHRLNGAIFTAYNTARIGNTNSHPSGNLDTALRYSDLVCRTGPNGIPAPGFVTGPVSKYPPATYVPSTPGAVAEITSVQNGNYRLQDSIQSAWRGTVKGYDGRNKGGNTFGGFCWDYDTATVMDVGGGGHASTYNNGYAIYDFAGATQPVGWRYLDGSDASNPTGLLNESNTNSDGRPVSVHTYSGMARTPDGRAWVYGGSRMIVGGNRTALVAFDPTKTGSGAYQFYGTAGMDLTNGLGHIMVYCPEFAKLLIYGPDAGDYCVFDPVTNAYTTNKSTPSTSPAGGNTQVRSNGGMDTSGAYDHVTHRLATVGITTDQHKVFTFNGSSLACAVLTHAGDTQFIQNPSPSICFDPEQSCFWAMDLAIDTPSNRAYLWRGVWTNATTITWTRYTLSGTAIDQTTTPGVDWTNLPNKGHRKIGVIKSRNAIAVINKATNGMYVIRKPV